MNFNPKSVEKQTGTMSSLGQLLTAVGVVAVILGAFGLVLGLLTEFRELDNDGPLYGLAGALSGFLVLFCGLTLSAGGAILHALRSIAINCARMAQSEE